MVSVYELAGLLVGIVVLLASRAMPKTMLLLSILAVSKNLPWWEYIVSATLVGVGLEELKSFVEEG